MILKCLHFLLILQWGPLHQQNLDVQGCDPSVGGGSGVIVGVGVDVGLCCYVDGGVGFGQDVEQF